MKIDVLAIGELLADLISNEYVNNLSEVKEFQMFQGGSPANLCANLKWLGKEVELNACIGEDSIGNFLVSNLAKVGLSDSYVFRNQQLPTSLVLVGKSKSSPDFIAYRMADSQSPVINAELIKSSQILHTSAFALSKDPSRTTILTAFRTAFLLKKEISCDWNFAAQIWQEDNGYSVFEDLCNMKPLLKLSIDDFQRFTGNPNASIENAKNFLDQYQYKVLCLTCGADGVWFTNEKGEWQKTEALKVKDVKDTTGAGDAFWAGFLNGRIEGLNSEVCVNRGIELASRKIQRIGPLYL
jgi:fructokinase